MMTRKLYPHCKRGVFGLKSWDPQRKPNTVIRKGNVDEERKKPVSGQQPVNEPQRQPASLQQQQPARKQQKQPASQQQQQPIQEQLQPASQQQRQPASQQQKLQSQNGHHTKSNSPTESSCTSSDGSANNTVNAQPVKPKILVAKYSYTANPASPIGDELTIKPGDILKLHSDENAVWWLTEDASGKVAYAPASYLMVKEDKPSTGGLPWLQNREEALEVAAPMTTAFGVPASRPKAKPYQSAYNRDSVNSENLKKFFCELCQKQLNGPQPYKAHMSSRNHRDQVEYENSTS